MWHLFNNCFLTRVVFINYKNSFPTRVYSREYKFSFFLFSIFFCRLVRLEIRVVIIGTIFHTSASEMSFERICEHFKKYNPHRESNNQISNPSKTLIFISSYFSLNNSLLQYPMRNLFHFKLRCLSYTNIIVS